MVISSPQFKGQPFVFPLELHARQHVLPAEIFGFDIAQQRSVGVFAVAGKFAHAIGHYAALLRGRRHHAPAGAHAEGVRRPSRGQVAGELVIRRSQRFPHCAVLCAGDAFLLVLDARADGKGLALHLCAEITHQGKGVPCAVPAGKDEPLTKQRFAALRAFQHHAAQHAVFDPSVR